MKSTKKKTKSKTRSKPKTHKKTRTETNAQLGTTTFPTLPESNPNLTLKTFAKTCQEVEVGDIGGFGSPEELEEHQKRCNEQATEFCAHCGKNLCHNHFEMIHRDHDRTMGGTNTPTLA